MTKEKTPPPRIDALDATKGVLVVLMIVYHSLNYTTQHYLAFKFLSFLPPSFIFLTGFLISMVYSSRAKEAMGKVYSRLIARGLKLAALFTLLNVAAHLGVRRDLNGQPFTVLSFLSHWQEIYVTGSGRFAVFEVLLPISYLLLLAPFLIWVGFYQKYFLPVITISLLVVCSLLEQQGYAFSNLNLLSAGVLGMLIGRLQIQKLDVLGRYLFITALIYCGHWYLGTAIGQTTLMQITGALIALAVIYGLCVRIQTSAWPYLILIRLGQYSLISYIAQICILQLLSRFVGRPEPLSPGFVILFTGALILTVGGVEFIRWARTRASSVDKLYKLVLA